jgi:hypothetical protein
VGVSSFFALFARKREQKRTQKGKEKECEKSKCAKRERKNANSHFFLPPTLEARLQSPKPFARVKKRGLE